MGIGQVVEIIQAAAQVAEVVAELVKDGLSDDEIRAHLSQPGSVAQDLIDACKTRKKKLSEFKEKG